MSEMCACGQRPVDNPTRPVDNSQNPARKILDAMSLDSKNDSYKSVKNLYPTGARETLHNLREVVHNQDRIVAAILDALDLLSARIDAIENRIQ